MPGATPPNRCPQEFEAAGRTIDPAAVQLLVDRAGGDISKLRGDVERLLLYTEGRNDHHGDRHRGGRRGREADVDDWAVVNAIGDGDVGARAARDRAALRPRRLTACVGGAAPLVGVQRLAQTARRSASRPAIDALLRTDLGAEELRGRRRVLVERLVIELTGRPVPRPRGGRAGADAATLGALRARGLADPLRRGATCSGQPRCRG